MDLKKGVLGIFLAVGLALASPIALSAYTETFSYDANGFLASHTDKNGVTTTYINNTRGLQVSRTEAAGTPAERTITTEWHSRYSLPLRITEPKKVTEYTYDDRGQMLTRTVTDPSSGESRTWTYSYNTLGLLASVDGPRTDVEDVTTYSYDTQGNLIESTNALGHSTRITAHDASGRPLTLVDANGVETTLTYDLRGRLLSRTTLGQTTSFTYDPVGNLTRITLPTGGYIEYTYDDARRLVAISDTDGNRIDYTVDLMGNRTAESVVDQSGVLARTRSMVYDQFSRLIQTIGAANQTTQYDYDGNNNTTQTTDALSRPTQQAFDALDRLINVTDPAQGQTQYAYDDQGNLIEVDDPRGVVTRYTYNGFGEVVELNSPDTGVTTYAYDPAGNLIRLTDVRGVTVNYAYDALNRITEVTYDDALLNVTYAYDQGTYGIGRLTAITDSNGATAFEYDAQGNVIAVTRLQGVTGYTVEYAYDAANNVIGMIYPSGRVVNYERDINGNVTRVTLTENGQTTVVAEGIDYEPFGPVTAMGYGNGLTLDHSYDLDGQLTAQVVSGARHVDLTYDPVGNITAVDDLLAGLESQQFTYDELDRLVDAMGDYGSVNWDYDATGNRLTENDNGTVRDYSIEDTSNRLLAIAGQVTKTYTYDANGNVTSDGVYDYRFDLTNRLVGASGTGMQASYAYNGLGQRAEKTVNGTTTHFVYGLNGELLGEYVEGAEKRSEYIWLNGQPLAVVAPTQIKQISETVYALKGEDRRGHAATARVNLDKQTVTVQAHDGKLLSATIEGRGWRERLRKDGTLVLAFPSRQADYRLRGRLHLANGTMTGKIVYHSKDRAVGRAAYEMTGTGAVSFVQGPEKLAWMHADHLGTPRAVTDEADTVVWRWASDPFGSSVANGDPDGDGARFTLNLRFPGQYYDAETGLHYNYFRDYDPETGRYIESDPIGLDGGMNTFGYTYQNPILYIDPLGLAKFTATFGGGAMFGKWGWMKSSGAGFDTDGNVCFIVNNCEPDPWMGAIGQLGGSISAEAGTFCEGQDISTSKEAMAELGIGGAGGLSMPFEETPTGNRPTGGAKGFGGGGFGFGAGVLQCEVRTYCINVSP